MRNNSPSRAMYKGLPTFRAGGVASCIDYSSVRGDYEGGGGHKSALTPTFFSHDHFSSSLADTEGVGIGILSMDPMIPWFFIYLFIFDPMIRMLKYGVYLQSASIESTVCPKGPHVSVLERGVRSLGFAVVYIAFRAHTFEMLCSYET